MSRIGRNYLEVGQYTEIVFPQKGIRFIAIDNGVDSNDPSTSEFAPILNLVNEWYVKDHSEKVRMSYRSRDYAGEHISNMVIYGYRWDPDNKGHWIVDEEAAKVVRHIFQLAAEGKGPGEIASILYREKVEKPSYYCARRTQAERFPDNPYGWESTTIRRLLVSEEYLGFTTNFKTNMPSYKSKRAVPLPKEQWNILEGTQEPIIDWELWRKAQEVQKSLREAKPKSKRFDAVNPLHGYVFCSDCGKALRNVRKREYPKLDKEGNPTGKVCKAQDFFACPTYLNGKKHRQMICSRHMVHTEVLNVLVLESLRQLAQAAMADEQTFLAAISRANLRDMESDSMKVWKASLRKNQKRHAELDGLIQGAYEANFKGNLTDERLAHLVDRYEAEQGQIEAEIQSLQTKCQTVQEQQRDGKQFLSIIRKVTTFEELTSEILETFVDKIVVHQHVGSRFKYQQEIEIYFKYIGNPALLEGGSVHEFNARV